MIRDAIAQLVDGISLDRAQSTQVMEEIMTGEATPAQIGAFTVALRQKGETVDEITGFAGVMRDKSIKVSVPGPVLDTCGTGGDGAGTMNISTAAAFVAAGAGATVAKHGNRAMSSACGSADVLEALGVNISLDADQVAQCLAEAGIGFMFAQLFHPAMKYAAGPRREIGVRTVFNFLGPLTNPAGARHQLLGVPNEETASILANALNALGSEHALVVTSGDGLDEISTTSDSTIYEVRRGAVRSYVASPQDFGFTSSKVEDIAGGDAQENASIIRSVFAGEKGPRRDVVLLNAGAALCAGDLADSIPAGIQLATESLDSGRATDTLEHLVTLSNELADSGGAG